VVEVADRGFDALTVLQPGLVEKSADDQDKGQCQPQKPQRGAHAGVGQHKVFAMFVHASVSRKSLQKQCHGRANASKTKK